MDLKTATPVEIDTELARIYRAKMAIARPIAEHNETVKLMKKYERAGMLRGRNGEPHYLVTREARQARRAKVAIMIISAISRRLEQPLNAEFTRRGGWTRFFLVSGGHLHFRGCGTLKPTTMIGWLPEDSGKNEAEVIEKWNVTACTHCFPDAPVVAKPTEKIVDGKCSNKGWKALANGASDPGRLHRFGECTHCGTVASITKAGNLRAHKVKA